MMDNKSMKYITISVLTFICYCNTLWGTFVFDDSEAILKNKDVLPETPLMDIFQHDFWGTNITSNISHKSYRPLTILSYRLNIIYGNNKFNAFQFHTTNIILYGILTILTIPIYELLIKKRKYEKFMNEYAFMSSLLFTVHPIHTESVAGLVGRADILCTILYLIIILLYNQYLEKKLKILFIIILILITCAVLCKETAITVLVVCILYDLFKRKKPRKNWLEIFDNGFQIRIIILIIYGLIIIYLRLKIMNFQGPIFSSIDNPAAHDERLFVRIFTYNYYYIINILLLIWPKWLCFDWSMGCIPLIENLNDLRIIFIIILWLICLIIIYLIYNDIKQNYVLNPYLMGLSMVVIPFIPASNLFVKVGFVIAERNLLLSSFGYCFLIIIGLKRLEYGFPKLKMLLKIIYYLLIIINISRTIERNQDWLNEEKLYNSALNVCPLNAKVHYNIAKIASDQNLKLLAIEEYKNAIKLHPNYEQAMNNLANLLRENEEYYEAELLLRNAIKIRPNFAAAWMNLAIVLTNLNRSKEAEISYKKAIELRPNYPDCYYNLGNLYLDQKRMNDALDAWMMTIKLRPKHLAAWSNCLVLLDTIGNYTDVIRFGKNALKLHPNASAIHFNLANTMGKMHKYQKAELHFLQAIKLNGTNPLYYSNLGVLYHRWGKTIKAKDMYKKALKLDPNMVTTRINLKKLD